MKSYFSFSVVARAVCVFLLFGALLEHPHSYYVLLRYLVSITAAYVTYLSYTLRRTQWTWMFGLIALLFNPFKPAALGRSVWAYVDVAVGVFFLLSCFFVRENP